VFLVSNISSVLRQPKETTPPASAPAAPVPAQPATEPANPPAIAPSVAQPTSDSPTTPSVPASAIPPADESKYNITGIMKDPDGKPVAVINGHVAYEGYYVDGAIVDKIETDRVTLDVKGQKSLLRLH